MTRRQKGSAWRKQREWQQRDRVCPPVWYAHTAIKQRREEKASFWAKVPCWLTGIAHAQRTAINIINQRKILARTMPSDVLEERQPHRHRPSDGGYGCDLPTLTPELIRTAVITDRETSVDKFPSQLQARTETVFIYHLRRRWSCQPAAGHAESHLSATGASRGAPARPGACTGAATTPPGPWGGSSPDRQGEGSCECLCLRIATSERN